MKKRILAFLLAFMMVLPFIMPVKSSAEKSKPYQENNSQETRIKLGNLDVDKYPKIDRKTILAINKQKRDEINGKKMDEGVQPFSRPWFPNQREPDNDEKSKLFGRIHVNFQLEGLKEGGTSRPFDWAGVFGTDEDGNQKYATVVFEQFDYETGKRTGISKTMQVDKKGTFTWSGDDGPSELPLYNRDTFKPYDYEVYLVQEKSKHIQLLTTGTLSTEGGTTFQKPDANGKILADVTLTIGLEQVSSTKFVSEWNTDVKEEDRPKIGGLFNTHKKDQEGYDIEGIFVFPRNNSEEKIIRDFNWDPNAEHDEMKDDIFPSWDLRNVATVSVDEPFTPRTDEYTRNEDDKTIVFTKGDRTYKYKYDFTYDVINGGKLTMTEIIPITFNANGGTFENFEAPDTASEVKKEVEYKKDLTTLPDEPTWSMHTFKGWSETADGKTPVDEEVFKTITEPKTYYAIWDELVDLSVEKTWKNSTDLTLSDNDYPTMKFTLYRKVEGGNDEKVADFEEKEITKSVTEAKWENLPKSDKDGKEYTYFVKESFKDSDIKNDNWKLGDFTSTNNAGTLVNTITNELVKPSGELKVKKVLENEVNKAQAQMGMMRSASLPIKFKFKVTGPYGYENEFELAAGETKTLTGLAYGDYVVTETDSKGYTPEYSKEKETLTKASPKGHITVTNKNLESTENNENIITKSVTKVWVGGEKPATTIELWRKGYDGSGKEFEQKVNEFTTVANGDDTQTKTFDSLAKHDSTGREFTYYAKEAKVPAGYTATYSDDKLKITNTMNIPQPRAGFILTDVGKKPSLQNYIDQIFHKNKSDDWKYEITEEPDVSKEGLTFAKIKVTFPDGSSTIVKVPVGVKKDKVIVEPCPTPNPPTPDTPTPDNPDKPNKPDKPIVDVDGKTRHDVAVNISKNYFGNAKRVILVQDMAYADSMSAMNISKGQIPILYTGRDTLYDVTREEILRVERTEIIVVGGPNTISPEVFRQVQALNNGKVTRVDGIDRFEVNKNSLAYFGQANKAVIASGMIYTDALSSVRYADYINAPILLVNKDKVPEIIAYELENHFTEAVLAGGPNTVSDMNLANIEALVGSSVERINGADRYVVSANLAARLPDPEQVIVTSGENWSDALVAGPLAQRIDAPVLLTAGASLPMPIRNYLAKLGKLSNIYVIGGHASISSAVRKTLDSYIVKEKAGK